MRAIADKNSNTPFFNLPLFLRLAVRELRGGLRGFYIFVSCIALGVAAIVGIGSLADALVDGISRQGQVLLGGDIAINRIHQRADNITISQFSKLGKVSEVATMRSMARKIDGTSPVLVEIKAVDNAYPLFGDIELAKGNPDQNFQSMTAIADPILFDRLGLSPGDQIRLNGQNITLTGIISKEPDRLSSRNAFGPRLMLSLETIEKLKLIQPASLIRWRYRIKLESKKADNFEQITKNLKTTFVPKGFHIRDFRDPVPGIKTALSRLAKFLTLVGLTALIIGGVGVANAINTFTQQKKETIATLKSIGAQNNIIFKIYLAQVLIISLIGISIGIVLGCLVPILIGSLYGSSLPIQLGFLPQLSTIALGAGYGLLVALLFIIIPLRRTREVHPQSLFRSEAKLSTTGLNKGDVFIIAILTTLLVTLAALNSPAKLLALYYCMGLAILLAIFFTYGVLIKKFMQYLPRIKGASFVIARSNMAGPGTLIGTIVLSLGLGLSLLVTISNIDNSLVSHLSSGLSNRTPSHFILDIRKDQFEEFKSIVKKFAPESKLSSAPMLRGRIIKLAGTDADKYPAKENAKWILRGDRGLSYAETIPEGAEIVEGKWWDKNYQGPPLVSFDAQNGKELGLKIGDEIVVNVLGRELKAEIANFRTVKWESFSINFVMIFSPNTLAGAPVNFLATLKPETGPIQKEAEFLQLLSDKFPNITPIRVRDAIEAISDIYLRIVTAIKMAGGLTLAAGALVLAGALATVHHRRLYETAVFKTLGATRWQILSAHSLEYLILSMLTGLISLLFGAAAAWCILAFILDIPIQFSLSATLQVMSFSVFFVLLFGIFGSWRILSAKTVPYLKGS